MNHADTDEYESVDVHAEDAADWIIRSALPSFLNLVTLTDEATYFSELAPFNGFTPKGRLRGWQGAGVRLAAAETSINTAFSNLLKVRNTFPRTDTTEAEREARYVCVFARSVMLPSRLGWDSYRVLSRASTLATCAAMTVGLDTQCVDAVWADAFNAIADRVLCST